MDFVKKGKKVTVVGAGNVGASIAFTLAIKGLCSELLLVDINKPKAKGEAMDIMQGTAFCPAVDVRDGDYEAIQVSGLNPKHVFGSGTVLDSSRLRTCLADHANLNIKNIHAYVFGEHGDSSMIPWSLSSIDGMKFDDYCAHIDNLGDKDAIEQEVRAGGAEVIKCKGATYYAIALSVSQIATS